MSVNRYWLAFNLVQGIGPVKIRALIEQFGGLEAAWQAGTPALQQSGLDKRALQNLLEARGSLDLDREAAKLEQAGVQALTWDDAGYPARLREIADPPPLLYVRGALLPEDDFAVAMVGTRMATAYGKEVARQLATGLARVAKPTDSEGWLTGVLRASAIPFAVVMVFVVALAWVSHQHCPGAVKLAEALFCEGL